MKRRTLEERLAAVRGGDLGELREALRSTSGMLIASAARQVAERRIDALAEELAPAFARLSDDPVKRDPGCRGKLAIARALQDLDRWDDAVFVAGLRHVQREGFAREDTASDLRGFCGLAHVYFGRNEALDVLAGLLADSERAARVAAARGLGHAGRRDATALLRYKLLSDDPEPEVTAACAEALIELDRDGSFAFLVSLLAGHDDRAESAALALAGARFEDAFEPLRDWCAGASPEQRHRVGYLAIALLRTEPATAYLLDAVGSNAHAGALAAARALATFKDDRAVADRLRAVCRDHGDAELRREIEALLG